MQNNDKIGVLFFTDRIEKFIPPKKGRKHILYIIRELIDFIPQGKGTDIGKAMEYLVKIMPKRCISFVLSDFLTTSNYSQPLTVAARKHDVVALHLYDHCMAELPNAGLIKVVDAETGHEQFIDTTSKAVRQHQRAWWLKHINDLENTFRKAQVDFASVATDADYVKPLMNIFAKR